MFPHHLAAAAAPSAPAAAAASPGPAALGALFGGRSDADAVTPAKLAVAILIRDYQFFVRAPMLKGVPQLVGLENIKVPPTWTVAKEEAKESLSTTDPDGMMDASLPSPVTAASAALAGGVAIGDLEEEEEEGIDEEELMEEEVGRTRDKIVA